ncbi:MAG: exodeoxyribonuclease VII large subunit, partial [Candidatus Saccharimonadales bacterium]
EQRSGLLSERPVRLLALARAELKNLDQLLRAFDPEAILKRGYAIVRQDGRTLRSTRRLSSGAIVDVQLADGRFHASVRTIDPKGAK